MPKSSGNSVMSQLVLLVTCPVFICDRHALDAKINPERVHSTSFSLPLVTPIAERFWRFELQNVRKLTFRVTHAIFRAPCKSPIGPELEPIAGATVTALRWMFRGFNEGRLYLATLKPVDLTEHRTKTWPMIRHWMGQKGQQRQRVFATRLR